ncbi:MAG: hypothetical protein JWM11_4506 [Planctomycetaceae bacterium]|nr:hypothetical protein [Planctomycetaceae bacterium]
MLIPAIKRLILNRAWYKIHRTGDPFFFYPVTINVQRFCGHIDQPLERLNLAFST